MWVVRWRIGLAFVGLTLGACDSQTRSPTLASTGADAANINSLLPPEDASVDASHADAGCKSACGDSGIADAAPATKDATTADLDATTSGLCAASSIAYDSHSLKAMGPTAAFANLYNTSLGSAPFGPFVIDLGGANDSADAKHVATIAGVFQANGKLADTTEPGASVPYQLTQNGAAVALHIAKTETPFHLAFTRAVDSQGDIAVAGIEVTASMDDSGCTSMPTVNATLYIAQSQAGTPFGSSTLGQLLGPTNTTLASGAGWAIPLSGSSQEIMLQ